MNLKAGLEMCEAEECKAEAPHAYLCLETEVDKYPTEEFTSQKQGVAILKELADSALFFIVGGTKEMVAELATAIKNSVLPIEPPEPPEKWLRLTAANFLTLSPEEQE